MLRMFLAVMGYDEKAETRKQAARDGFDASSQAAAQTPQSSFCTSGALEFGSRSPSVLHLSGSE